MGTEQNSLEIQGVPTVATADRRPAVRAGQKYVTQMTPWSPGHASVPVEVILIGVSDSQVSIIHDKPLSPGLRHLITVPRSDDLHPVVQEYSVIRCQPRTDGTYTIDLGRAVSVHEDPPRKKRVVSEQTKLLLLLFGIFGLLIAAFAPL